jgi:hypothetical protein
MTECDKIAECSFLKEYKDIAASTIQKMINLYCTGTSSKECLRKKYIEKIGEDPPVAMMPNGINAESGRKMSF